MRAAPQIATLKDRRIRPPTVAKTDNEKYVKRGADIFIGYDPGWQDEVGHANEGKVGAPYRYSESLLMLAAAFKVAMGAPYRQLEGMVGKMVGESQTPSFSQLYKRINRLDVDTDQTGVVTVSDRKHSRILAADATGLKRHNRGEWMRAKWKVRRGFVKMHVLVDTETMRILALSVTDDSVGDSTMFSSLLGQHVDAIRKEGGPDGAPDRPKATGPSPDAPAGTDGALPGTEAAGPRPAAAPADTDGASSCLRYKNHLASGASPLASLLSGSAVPDAPDLLLCDAAYSSRDNVAACARAGITPGIMHTVNVTGRGKGSGDAWGLSVRDQLGASPNAKRLDLMSQEEKRENQAYWKARLGYNMRWVVEGVFSMFKRMFGEHVTALKWENIVQEIRLKVALYNRWRDESMARELGEGAMQMA